MAVVVGGASWRCNRALSSAALELLVGSLMRQLQLLSIHLEMITIRVSKEGGMEVWGVCEFLILGREVGNTVFPAAVALRFPASGAPQILPL